MNKTSTLFFRLWRPAVMLLALAVIAYLLFFNNLSHLLPGYASPEVSTHNAAASLRTVIDNPVDAPYKLLILLAAKLGYHSLIATRVVAASYGVLACLIFFVLVRGWYNYRVAFLSTVMFATSGGFLHVARFGSSLILQMGVLLLMGTIFWYRRTAHPTLVGYVAVGFFAVFWYIPGMIWFELIALGLLHKGFWQSLRRTSWPHILSGVLLFAAILAPLIHAFIKSPGLLRAFAGLPGHIASMQHMAANLGTAVLSIGVRSNGSPELWLGHAPLLNIIEGVLLLLGAYLLAKRIRSPRSVGLFCAFAASLLLISLGGTVSISSLVPLLYLFIAGGLHVLIKRWLTVFPRNPIARSGGILLVFLMVFFSVLYQVRSYYVAWPHDTATKQAFSQQQLR